MITPFAAQDLSFEPLQSGVQRSLLHLQDVVGELADALRDRPAVERLQRDRFHDQQIDGALDQVGGFAHPFPLVTYKRLDHLL
jgi:hypothetical protein